MHKTQILEVDQVTHDVKRFVIAEPEGFDYKVGDATEIAVDEDGWREETRPFTMTSLPEERALEFTLRIGPVIFGGAGYITQPWRHQRNEHVLINRQSLFMVVIATIILAEPMRKAFIDVGDRLTLTAASDGRAGAARFVADG